MRVRYWGPSAAVVVTFAILVAVLGVLLAPRLVVEPIRGRVSISLGYTAYADTTANNYPTGDENNTGGFTVAPLWSKVDDTSNTDYITGVTKSGGHATFSFTAFNVPVDSTGISISITYSENGGGTSAKHAASLKVGGNYYDNLGIAATTSGFQEKIYATSTNPKSGQPWTVAEINGTDGTNPLQAFGVSSSDFNPDVQFGYCYAKVTYTPQPAITVSPTTYDFGVVAESSTPSTTTSYFTIDNTSTMITNNTVSVTTSTWSGGTVWTHSDTATAGPDTAGLKANKGGTWGTGDVIVKYASPSTLATSQAANTDWSFGLKLIAPTSFTDGVQKQNTVRITASAV